MLALFYEFSIDLMTQGCLILPKCKEQIDTIVILQQSPLFLSCVFLKVILSSSLHPKIKHNCKFMME